VALSLAGSMALKVWWYYFPVAFLIKTPVALLLMLMGGLILCAKRWRLFLRDEAFLLVPIAFYLGSAMTARLNIGLRHILPIYPFCCSWQPCAFQSS